MIKFHVGDSKLVTVTVVDDDGDLVDITGAVVRWEMAKSERAIASVVKLSTDSPSDIVLTAPQVGEFTVAIRPEDTELLPPGIYYYEAEVTMGAIVGTVVSGHLLLRAALIRPEVPP